MGMVVGDTAVTPSAAHNEGERTRWIVAPPAPAGFMAGQRDLHPVAAQVLYNRGLTSPTQIRSFLASHSASLYDPGSLHGMDRAVDRLRRAFQAQETIAVHGDFDVDGIGATAILTEGLRAAGERVIPFVPLRTARGYGVQAAAVQRLAGEGARVIVTGDTGTRAVEAVRQANALGVDVIITDHHLPGDELPDALALVNPQQQGCSYPFKELSGAGVAWKLVHALALDGALGDFPAEELLDLVALGTIVDVSPLTGENRTLVQRGLRRLSEAPRVGVRALLAHGQAGQRRRASGPVPGLNIDERTVAFTLGPRLNAAGRMNDAAAALELLLTSDSARAAQLVGVLEEQNAQRQRLTEHVLLAAQEQAERLAHQPVLVLRAEGWPAGVIGLVAARMAEAYQRPAFVVEVRDDVCRGSGRSPRGAHGFDLVHLLSGCADILVEYGGHTQAAGFAVLPQHLEALAERLVAAAAQEPAAGNQTVVADAALAEADLTWYLYEALFPLRPFGAGNPEPLFFTPHLQLLETRSAGAGDRHLRARVRLGAQVVHAFGPNLGHHARRLAASSRIDALYALDVSTWAGYPSLELRLQDVRPATSHPNESPQRVTKRRWTRGKVIAGGRYHLL